MLEESGYVGDFQDVGSVLVNAYSTKTKYGFIARNCVKEGEPLQSRTEQVEVELVSESQLRDILKSGQMSDVSIAYMALDLLGKL